MSANGLWLFKTAPWACSNGSRLDAAPSRTEAIVDDNTTIGSRYYTDEYRAYASLRLRGTRVTVAKEIGNSEGRTRINGIGGFRSGCLGNATDFE